MKKQINMSMKNTSSKFLFFLFTAVFFISPVFNNVQAQDLIKSGGDVYVNYVGTSGGQPVFLVRFNNTDKHYEHLRISNKEGLVLYKEKLTGENFTKRFQIDIPSEESFELILTFTDKEGKHTQKYVVNSNMLTVRNVEVTKL